MQRQGKTLVIISHDDRYFGLADRICKFELGRLVDVSAPPAPQRREDGVADARGSDNTSQLESA